MAALSCTIISTLCIISQSSHMSCTSIGLDRTYNSWLEIFGRETSRDILPLWLIFHYFSNILIINKKKAMNSLLPIIHAWNLTGIGISKLINNSHRELLFYHYSSCNICTCVSFRARSTPKAHCLTLPLWCNPALKAQSIQQIYHNKVRTS